jgi:hypothetical protein
MRLLSKVLWFLWYRVLRYLVMVLWAPIVWFYIVVTSFLDD